MKTLKSMSLQDMIESCEIFSRCYFHDGEEDSFASQLSGFNMLPGIIGPPLEMTEFIDDEDKQRLHEIGWVENVMFERWVY